jgi:hypothetical protein
MTLLVVVVVVVVSDMAAVAAVAAGIFGFRNCPLMYGHKSHYEADAFPFMFGLATFSCNSPVRINARFTCAPGLNFHVEVRK